MARVKSNTTTCKHCGAEIAKSAKTCPSCGGKNKKPVFKRVWFWIIIIGIIGGVIGGGGSSSAPDEKIEYTQVTAHDLFVVLHENAMEAEDYTDQYLEISGVLENKDSDGSYISIGCPNANETSHIETCWLSNIQAYIKDDDALAKIKPMKKGEAITVRVQITDVGEVLGYSADIKEVI